MKGLVILDETVEYDFEAWEALKAEPSERVIILSTDTGIASMFYSRSLLAAALMSGLVVAHGPGGAAIAPHRAIRAVESFEDRRRGKGKGRFNHRPSGVAAAKRAKRAKATRRNIAKRASKRA